MGPMPIIVTETTDREAWDEWVLAHGGHPLQLWGWGELKAKHNWVAHRLLLSVDGETVAAAQVLSRTLPRPFKFLHHVPRGPVTAFDPTDEKNRSLLDAVLNGVANWTRRNLGGVGIKVEPDWETKDFPASSVIEIDEATRAARIEAAEKADAAEGAQDKVAAATQAFRWPEGWIDATDDSILAPHTFIIDLNPDLDTLMANMRASTRQRVRKAGRNGVQVHVVTDPAEVEIFLKLYHETGERAGFLLHEDQYYRDLFDAMGPEHAPLYMATTAEGEPLSFLWLGKSATTCWEFYSAENALGRKSNANQAIKWQVMQDMKADGVTRYDLNGLINPALIEFKTGFSSKQEQNWLVGTGDKAFGPMYTVWNKALPVAQKIRHKLAGR